MTPRTRPFFRAITLVGPVRTVPGNWVFLENFRVFKNLFLVLQNLSWQSERAWWEVFRTKILSKTKNSKVLKNAILDLLRGTFLRFWLPSWTRSAFILTLKIALGEADFWAKRQELILGPSIFTGIYLVFPHRLNVFLIENVLDSMYFNVNWIFLGLPNLVADSFS